MANPLKLLKLKPTGFQFIQETPIAAPPKKVWSALLDISSWFVFDADQSKRPKQTLEVWPGGRWFWEFPDGTMTINATVVLMEPQKLLRLNGSMGLTHLPAMSAIIFELQPKNDGKGTLLRLGQRTFGLLDADAKKRFMGGWKRLLPQLKALAEKR